MSELVFHAFKALGPHGYPHYNRTVALIAKALRESGDAEALALFGMDVNCEPLEDDNGDVYECVAAVADRAGKKDDARYLVDFVWSFDSEYGQRCLATHPGQSARRGWPRDA